MEKIIYVLLFTLFLVSGVNAGVSVDPVQLYILSNTKQKTTNLVLDAKGETNKRVFEINAYKWTQDDQGENHLELDHSIIVNPKNFILQANTKQTLRVGFNRPIESVITNNEEAAWRILIDEIPQATEQKNESIMNFLISFNLPLFVGKEENTQLQFSVENKKLKVKNLAKSHIQISNLSVVDANKKILFNSTEMKYILAGKTAYYALDSSQLNQTKNLIVQLNTDKSHKTIELKFSE